MHAQLYTSSTEDGPPRYCTVFTYLAKSGGSSIKQQLIKTSRLEHAKHPGIASSTLSTDARIVWVSFCF